MSLIVVKSSILLQCLTYSWVVARVPVAEAGGRDYRREARGAPAGVRRREHREGARKTGRKPWAQEAEEVRRGIMWRSTMSLIVVKSSMLLQCLTYSWVIARVPVAEAGGRDYRREARG